MNRYCVDFFADKRGNVAMLFGVIFIPMLLVAAFAIDSSRHLSSNRHIQAAVDAASLAAALALEDAAKTDADIVAIAKTSYLANLTSTHGDVTCEDPTVTINRTVGTVNVAANCKTPTMLGEALSRENMDSSNSATARANVTKLDLALMLDVSGSMGGSKLEDLKTAAKEAAATLITADTGDRVRIGFATYATSVNAGVYGNPALGRPANDDSDGDGLGKVCVSERVGSAAWKDDKPELGKYVGDDANYCPNSSVLPLTKNLSNFNTEIDKLTAGGRTAGHLGIAWSWYLIAPDWDDIWPAESAPLSYTEPDSSKAVILMTDGQFNEYYEGSMGNSNEQARKMCQKMRDQDIIVYAVAFQAPTSAKATLENCTGNPDRFFDASDGEDLLNAYATIASQLSALSLVH